MPTPTSAAETPLLEISFTRVLGSPSGLRVFADGRYEQLGDVTFNVADDGSSTADPAPLAWRPVVTLSADELAELRQAIADANFAALQPRYRDPAVHDGVTMIWKVAPGADRYEVAVEGYPSNRVPALDTLFERFSRLRKLPPSRSEWRVWVDGRFERRDVNCDVSGVVELRGLVQALLVPQTPGSGAAITAADLPDLPASEPLVEVLWQEQGRPDERTMLYGDGRLERVAEGKTTALRTLSPAELAAVLEAGAGIDWAQLPDPVCG